MKRIGLLSDTHGDLDSKIYDYFKDVDEIWHAGDIGSKEVADQLEEFKPVRIVYGNIDGHELRVRYKEYLFFQCEKVKVLLTHIGGKPESYYYKRANELINKYHPNLFVCGHSHICLVKYDSKKQMLWMNPGACGNKGFHKVKTVLRFSITEDRIHDLEVIEWSRRV